MTARTDQPGARPNLLVVGAPPDAQAALAPSLGAFEVRGEPVCADALAAAQRLAADAVAVDLRADAGAAVQAIDRLHRAHPELPLVALHDRKDPDLILEVMRAGAREFLLTGDGDALGRVFGDLARQVRGAHPAGAVISVFPAKGGLGATTLATNLAGALRAGDKRVVLVDLDFQMGDALVYLDLASRYGIKDVLANQHRLDGDLLSSSLTRHASGLFVLAQPEAVGESEEPTAADVTKLLAFLALHFDYVVCDGLRRFDERAVAALDASSHLALVVAQNVPAIRNAHRALEVFRRLGYGQGKVALVVNRFQKGEEIGPPELSQHLGLGVSALVANDYRAVMGAVNKGQLLEDAAPRARVTEDVRRLALALSGLPRPLAGPGFLKRLFGEANHGAERSPEAL